MNLKQQRHNDLILHLEEEALESRAHLHLLQSDISKKNATHQGSLTRI